MKAQPFPAPLATRRTIHTWARWLMLTWLLCWATGCASLPTNVSRPRSSALSTPEATALGQLATARRADAAVRAESGFRLLDSVDLAYSARLALIEGAQQTLDIQYYAIHADASTEYLLQRLRAAARRGVRVRVLLDDFNSVGEDAQVLRLAYERNIELRLFNPLTGPRNSLIGRIVTSLHDAGRMQKRMHNKLFLADSAWGITGGRNLGDAYFGSGDKSNFVDLDVLAAGRVVRDMAASFDRYWNNELAYPVQSLLTPEDLEELRKPEREPAADPSRATDAAASPPASAPALKAMTTVLPSVTPTAVLEAKRPPLDLRSASLTWAPATFLVDKPGKVGPGDDEVQAGDTVIDGLLSLMQNAQKDILIVSPYFVPGAQMMAVYESLRQRGVRVRVLTNSLASNDAPAAHAGYARYRNQLLAIGVELYEMRANPETAADLIGKEDAGRSKSGSGGLGLGSGPGGSKAGTRSRASLHSKAVLIDGRLAVIGSMNFDLRSQLKNSEAALVIRSPRLAAEATRQLEAAFATAAYRLERQQDGRIVWRAPSGAAFKDTHDEPEASTRLKIFVRLLGPLAPDQML